MRVADFLARRPYLQRSLARLKKHQAGAGTNNILDLEPPQTVLSFFFGVDYQDPNDVEHWLRQGRCTTDTELNALWFQGGPDYDETCRPFAALVRAAGKQPPTLSSPFTWLPLASLIA